MDRTRSCKRVLFVQSKTIMFYNLQTIVEEKGLMLLQLKGFFFFLHTKHLTRQIINAKHIRVDV